MDHLHDVELMCAAQHGDQDAFVLLVRRHQDSLLNFFRRLGAYNDADDLVQETFVRLFRYRRQYRPSAKFATFLFTLARHAWIDSRRRMRRREQLHEKLRRMPPAAEAQSADRGFDIQAALDALSEKLRIVVVMHIYHGFDYSEIAVALGIPLGTVKSRMHLALQQLEELFREQRQ